MKKPKPKFAFWRKEFYEKDKSLRDLTKIYQAELSEIQKLLKTFSPIVLANAISKTRIVGIKTVKKATRDKVLYLIKKLQKEFDARKVAESPQILEHGGTINVPNGNKMSLLDG